MNKLIIPCLAAFVFVSLSACTTVKEPATHDTTTTTDETTVHRPVDATTTTETRSSY